MESITRRFILFQGVAIGILAIVHAIVIIYTYIDYPYDHWDYNSDIHGLPKVIIPVELCWIIAAGALLYGIHRQDIRFFYPIIFVAIGVLVVQLVREILLFWGLSYSGLFWYLSLFCNPVLMISLACRRIHGVMTLIAMKRLFVSEPNADNNFVRFNAESDECEVGEGNTNR